MSDDNAFEIVERHKRQVLYRAKLLERRRQRRFQAFLGRCAILFEDYFVEPLWHAWVFLWRVTLGRKLFVKEVIVHEQAQREAAAMRLVASETSVPAPRPLVYLRWRGRSYIFMTRARGVVLKDVWMTLSEEDRSAVVSQLAGFVAQLRALQSPFGSRICSVLGTRLADVRLGWRGGGPFEDESHFNVHLREGLELSSMPDNVVQSHSITHSIHFTHGDLHPRNIMVEGARITSVFDWGEAGWYPAYWERRKASIYFPPDPASEDWQTYVPLFAPDFDMEVEADRYLMDNHWSFFCECCLVPECQDRPDLKCCIS